MQFWLVWRLMKAISHTVSVIYNHSRPPTGGGIQYLKIMKTIKKAVSKKAAGNSLEKVRHSLSHLLAEAVLKQFSGTKLGIGPVIENGFYYDFDFGNAKVTDKDLQALENRMRGLMKKELVFKKEKTTYDEAKKFFKNQPYKLELIKDLKKDGKEPTMYATKSGKEVIFADLCAGPHVASTKEINPEAFKLQKIAGAYWKGSEKNQMLTRIYGLAFETKEDLEAHLHMLEEAERRDHRVLAEKLDMFMVDEKIGKGLPLWLPNGHLVRHLIETYMYDKEQKAGYKHVLTPILAKEGLYKTSGHLAHYKEDMYAPIEIEGERYYLRPMNCPHHHSIYNHKLMSYRDLPFRMAEFGNVFRFERSGTLSGMIRTRGFTQNDSHIYATQEQLEAEIIGILELFKEVYDDFNISGYWFRLSLPDFKNKEKYGDVKNKKMWEDGASVLRSVLKKLKLEFVEGFGEASFYGPKIDIQIKNIYGKEDTIATIQVDYYSAAKFNLNYIDKDGTEQPVVVIHRAILGSFERFFSFLLETTAGDLPTWLSPVQCKVINVGETHLAYAKEVAAQLEALGARVEVADYDGSVGKKIREAEIKRIPYLLVIGDKEVAAKSVAVRKRGEGDLGIKKTSVFLKEIEGELTK